MRERDVYGAVEAVRQVQSEGPGPWRGPHEVGAWLLLMQRDLEAAADAWQESGDQGALLHVVDCLAAGVSCLLEHWAGTDDPGPGGEVPSVGDTVAALARVDAGHPDVLQPLVACWQPRQRLEAYRWAVAVDGLRGSALADAEDSALLLPPRPDFLPARRSAG
jgi:hypothetical protein